jgi:predicted MFS family arabinose efflux permease
MSRKLWIIILCAGAIMALSVGIRQALGLFLAPVSGDLGLGRESYALAMGLTNLFWGLAAPAAGAMADRYGAGKVAAFGGLAYAAGLVVLMLSGDGTDLLIGGTFLGFGLSGSGFTVILGVVGRMAPENKRSQALGLASVGGSIGQFVSLPYTHHLIDGVGWVIAFGVLAATAMLIVPLAYGLAGKPAEPMNSRPQAIGDALREAFQVPSFLLLNAGFFVCGFHLAFVGIHLPAFLIDKGFAASTGTIALTVVGITNIIGVYLCGVLGGRYTRKSVLSGLYLARALIFLLFIITPITEVTIMIFAATIGFLWLGTVPLTSGIVGHIFGTQYMSMLFGIVFLVHQFGGFLGAWLAGVAFDAFGSYDIMWWLSIALGLMSAALHWPIAERPITRPEAILPVS